MSRNSKAHASIHDEMAAIADKELLSWVKNGKPIITETGEHAKSESGKKLYRPLIAAEMRVVLDRLRQIGVQSPAMPGTPSGNLIDAARARGMKYEGRTVEFPAVDEDEDDYATRSSG